MKQAPAGSFAVWSSCLLQREGLPFVDAVVWGFGGNWFLYLPDLLGGDLLCTLVQAVEFTEKSMPRGWVGFFSLLGLFYMCNLTRRQPTNVAFRATPNSAQNYEPRCLHQWWGAGEDHEVVHPISSWWHGSSPTIAPRGRARGSPIEWEPHTLCIAGATEQDRQQITSPGSISQ